ncbi:hypothetical protein M514_24941 [Trichuris suis]|uniref:Uncharacterized protein n=1 Tax=Trichuris suis TaxID=68888 RepID=A0A085N0A5_9BILA|nr:hypothetical protein M514_24941 [Trichuris suis]
MTMRFLYAVQGEYVVKQSYRCVLASMRQLVALMARQLTEIAFLGIFREDQNFMFTLANIQKIAQNTYQNLCKQLKSSYFKWRICDRPLKGMAEVPKEASQHRHGGMEPSASPRLP